MVGKYTRRNNHDKVPIIVKNVYSSCNIKEKYLMWDDIAKIKLVKACKT